MKSQMTRWIASAVLLVILCALFGCGSEGGFNAESNAATSTSADAGSLDARKTIHSGTLQVNQSTSTSSNAGTYIVKGCYVVSNVSCPGNEEIASSIMASGSSALCFEHVGNDYYLHSPDWKYPVMLTKDNKNWFVTYKKLLSDGYYELAYQGQPVSTNASLDMMSVNFTHVEKDSCGNSKNHFECTVNLKYDDNFYSVAVKNKVYNSPSLDQACDSASSGTSNLTESSSTVTLQKWVKQTSGTTDNLNAIAYGNGKYVAVGDGGVVLNSTDAKNWTLTTKLNVIGLQSVVFGNGNFVTAGWGSIFVSIDGVKWDLIKDTSLFVQKIIRTDSQFVAVGLYLGTNGVISSADGVIWSKPQNGDGTFLVNIAYGNGIFLSVGAKGEIITSSDSMNWVTQKSPTTNSIPNLAFGNNLFLAVDSSGKIYTSGDNGISWSPKGSSVPYLSSVIYNNGKFIGTGYQYIYESVDGDQWTQVTESISGYAKDLLFDGSKYVVVGWSGLILTSQ